MKKKAKALLSFLCFAAVVLVSHPAPAQDQNPALQAKLDGLYTLTKMTADGNDIVKPGTILVLHKDGLKLSSIQAQMPITNTYKDGRLSPGTTKWSFAMAMAHSDTPVAQIPLKVFDSGEKIWVTNVTATKGGIVLKVYSDPYQDVRYYGQIEIPVDKKHPAADDDLLHTLAEVISPDAPAETAAIAAPGSAAAAAQAASINDPKEALKRKLAETIVLAKSDPSSGDITTAGSLIELRKDGLVLWSQQAGVTPNCQYKEGKFSMPFTARMQANSDLNAKGQGYSTLNVPQRKFVAGEKIWITESHVRDNGVFFTFVSDAYQDVRYTGTLSFPFEKKQPIPSVDAFLKTMNEVIAVEPPPGNEQQTQAAPPPAPARPAAVPPPAPIPPPPAPTKTVALGQSKAEVKAILGEPMRVAALGAKEIFYYSDMKITFLNGKVKDVE
ncbi:MAG TPA: hypothetical protein VIM62_10320 [Acidobacteriaceae bacterium]